MPPRTSHRKSRNGCMQCRKRHTKCDEKRPSCSCCVRLKRECVWRQRSSTPPDVPATATGGVAEDALSMPDLILIHHFTSYTYHHLDWDHDPSLTQLWQQKVPELGFQYPYLLRGLLAISALHKASLCRTPEMLEGYLTQSSVHLEHCLKAVQDRIRDADPEEALPVFLSSSLIAMYSYGVTNLPSAGDPDPIEQFLHCAYLTRGVRAIHRNNRNALQSCSFASMFGHAPKVRIQASSHKLDLDMQNLKLLIDRWLDESDTSVTSAPMVAVEMLSKVLKESKDGEFGKTTVGIILRWPAIIPVDFLTMIERRESVALAVLGRFVLAFGTVGTCWWLHDMDTKVLASIQEILNQRRDLEANWADLSLDYLIQSRNMMQEDSSHAKIIDHRNC